MTLNWRAWPFPLLLVAALETWARTLGKGSDAVAAPSKALQALFGAMADGSIWLHSGFTLGSALLGLSLAAALALPLGTLLGLSRRAADLSFLSIELLRPIPSVALIPLSMLIFGFGLRMELAVIAFACFWPLLILVQSAVRQIDPALLEVARALEMRAGQRFASIVFPAIVPRLFVALRLGTAIALVVAVTVEIAANPHGMGYALMIAQQSLDPALMMAWLLWIGVVGVTLNALTLRLQAWAARHAGAPS